MADDDPAGPHGRWPVIALVASAGGLEAITHTLDALPADLAASIVVLLHQAPERRSVLTSLLARRCRLPVAVASAGATLAPAQVVVIPPGRHLLVTPALRTLLIATGSVPPSRPSADLLLATMATALGPRAVAVVLSGQGHDGATGAEAIHALGGTVLATDEASSASFSMPSAAIGRDGTVDHVVALDALAPMLCELAARRAGAAAEAGPTPGA